MNTAHYYLENESGNRINLTVDSGNNLFVKNVDGLGIEKSNTVVGLDNGFAVMSNEAIPASELVAECLITANAMTEYKAISDYLQKAKELYFIYKPENAEYRRHVAFSYITKANRDRTGMMSMAIGFSCLSPWYSISTATGTSISITAAGQMPTAIVASMTAPAATNGIVIDAGDYGKCTTSRGIAAGDVITYSSIPGDCYIKLNGASIIDYVDVMTKPFIQIPAGETATITCGISMAVSVFSFWGAV